MWDRDEKMFNIAKTIEDMIKTYNGRQDIMISFLRMNEINISEISEWDRERFQLRPWTEYFGIYETNLSENEETHFHLLYVVNVTADSYLTAAQELMDLVAAKF